MLFSKETKSDYFNTTKYLGNRTSSGFGKLIAQTLAKDGHQVFASMRGINGKNEDAATQPNAPDPQDVADAVKKLVDTPAGRRPLRTVVGTLMVTGVESLNRAYDNSKQEMLTSLGVA